MRLPPMAQAPSPTEQMLGTIGDPTRNGAAPGGISMDMRQAITPEQQLAAEQAAPVASRLHPAVNGTVPLIALAAVFVWLNANDRKGK